MEPIVGCGHLKTNNLDEILSFVTSDLALVDSRSVCGIEHLHQAAFLSLSAHTNGYNLSNDKSTEVLLYLTAQRQISKALKFAGITEYTKSIGWVSYGNISSDFLGIIDKDNSVISVSNFDFSKFAKDVNNKFDNNLKQKIVMTRTATLPTQTR